MLCKKKGQFIWSQQHCWIDNKKDVVPKFHNTRIKLVSYHTNTQCTADDGTSISRLQREAASEKGGSEGAIGVAARPWDLVASTVRREWPHWVTRHHHPPSSTEDRKGFKKARQRN